MTQALPATACWNLGPILSECCPQNTSFLRRPGVSVSSGEEYLSKAESYVSKADYHLSKADYYLFKADCHLCKADYYLFKADHYTSIADCYVSKADCYVYLRLCRHSTSAARREAAQRSHNMQSVMASISVSFSSRLNLHDASISVRHSTSARERRRLAPRQ